MKIFYNKKSMDGVAAAAIIYGEYGITSMMSEKDFIPFDSMGPAIPYDMMPEIIPDETCFFLDLNMHQSIELMKECITKGCKVIHIDDENDQKRFDMLKKEPKEKISKVIKFYNEDLSTTMMAWLYINFPKELRTNPMEVNYEFAPGYSHFVLNGDRLTTTRIPYGFRLINDQKPKEFKETPAFIEGLLSIGNGIDENDPEEYNKYIAKFQGDITPMSNIWGKIQNDDRKFMNTIIAKGERELLRK